MAKPSSPVRRNRGDVIPGAYKVSPHDFLVEELPAYPFSGDGEHSLLWIEKTRVSTLDAVSQLGRALGRRDREFGFAGMKDSKAVTRQWISIAGVDDRELAALELDGIRVLETTRHVNKLKLGHLRGNRFSILVRGAGEQHAATARAALADMATRGVPNYFGEQRFGKRGANLDKGLRILHGNPRKAARTMPRRLLNLVVSAVQSEVFNRVLSRRIDAVDQLWVGDAAWIHKNGACFSVEDVVAEQPRCDAFEISPSGPLPGPKMLRAKGEMDALEQAVLDEMSLDPEVFGRMPYGTHDGARRPLRVPLWEPEVAVEDGGLRLDFALPRGAYATAVLGEILQG